ncbi:Fatty acid desaturase [Pirellulimonas nuda]|uniref:Fatty acid desaturase n=1 Tax=Pirellulimonas nuda TaxID=2528009 RepID=A0A518D8F4_9BACT|nr:fatty acid desaturase [Pirellulimonas nuda]QDU87734.1 Fatty acid desaturase [Pirellulimonas nuda]
MSQTTTLRPEVSPEVAPEEALDAPLNSTHVDTKRLDLPEGVDTSIVQWGYAISFVVIHAAACLIFVPWLFSWVGVITFLVGMHVYGQLGVPICYHRLLTHKSFKSPKWFERSLATLALFSAQETPARWVAWHRMHHQHSDHQPDPHSPLVTFFWAHAGWLCVRNKTTHNFLNYEKYARDILQDPYYMWVEKLPMPMLLFFTGHAAIYFAVAWAISACFYGPASMEALRIALSVLVWGVFARVVLVWHFTWSVNSLSHLWGYRNHETTDDSRNNWFVAIVTGGEGWHNNHHADQSSASVQHRWWEIDTNYYIIRLFEKVGLAWDIVPPLHVRRAEQARTK